MDFFTGKAEQPKSLPLSKIVARFKLNIIEALLGSSRPIDSEAGCQRLLLVLSEANLYWEPCQGLEPAAQLLLRYLVVSGSLVIFPDELVR